MLKTVKHGSGIRVDPPPWFFKIPTFSRFFLGGASLSHIFKAAKKKTSEHCNCTFIVFHLQNFFIESVGNEAVGKDTLLKSSL